MRCDANVSLRPAGQAELGTKVEIKNLNSWKNVQHALEYEIGRQAPRARRGRAHRPGDSALGSGQQRHRVDALQGVRARLPLLPRAGPAAAPRAAGVDGGDPGRRSRSCRPRAASASPAQYGLPAYDALLLTQGRGLADYFESAAREYPNPKILANWILNELLRELPGDDDEAVEAAAITPPG